MTEHGDGTLLVDTVSTCIVTINTIFHLLHQVFYQVLSIIIVVHSHHETMWDSTMIQQRHPIQSLPWQNIFICSCRMDILVDTTVGTQQWKNTMILYRLWLDHVVTLHHIDTSWQCLSSQCFKRGWFQCMYIPSVSFYYNTMDNKTNVYYKIHLDFLQQILVFVS